MSNHKTSLGQSAKRQKLDGSFTKQAQITIGDTKVPAIFYKGEIIEAANHHRDYLTYSPELDRRMGG